MNNIIVLTHGWTGSSVFSALLGQAGCWLGAETMHKPDYNTFENVNLVALNNQLLKALSPGLNHEHHFSPQQVNDIAQRAAGLELAPYRQFVADCQQHQPWLWKDPRLTWTIRVWAQVLDLKTTTFLVLTRDTTQAWISANTRRHVQSFGFTRDYNGGITQSNLQFLTEHQLPFVQMSFEDLLLAPEATLDKLNLRFGTALTLAHLRSVCHEPLHQKSRGWKDFMLAALIYLKNFNERDGRSRRQATP